MPADYGSWSAVYALFRRWQRDGTWARLLTALQALADAAGRIVWDVSVDSTTARAHQHAAGARKRGIYRPNRPAALQYPHATTQGQQLRGQYFLHRSCQPLDEVDLDPPAHAKRHLRLVTPSTAAEEDDPEGCSPWSCRSGTAIAGQNGQERAA